MAVRFRFRRIHVDQGWSEPFRLLRLMRSVRERQQRYGGDYRKRRRDEQWGRWWQGTWPFRVRLRRRLRSGPTGIYQFQVGGKDGPIYAVGKYQLPLPELTQGEKVIEAAKSELGTVYRFGEANGPEDPGADAFDCSGFTQWAWATEGIYLPHSAELQRTAPNVSTITSEAGCAPGDLVFMWFPNSRGIPRDRASHVGLWLKPGWVIDTRNPVSSPVGIRQSAGVIGYGRPHGGQQV